MNNITQYRPNEVQTVQTFNMDYYNRFINYLDASEKTIQTYSRALKQFFKWIYQNNITQPQRADIIEFRNHLQDNYKPTTVQSYMIAVKLFFKWTEAENLYKNVADNVKGAKLDRQHKKDYFTTEQIKDMIGNIDTQSVSGLRNRAILLLMVTGALRTIEVSRANIEDLRTLGNHTVLYVQGKGKQERTEYIKIPLAVEKDLRAYLSTREDKSPQAPLFASTSNNNSGKRMTTRSISRICKDIFIANGYDSDRLTAHSLRHTAITLALLNGQEITQVQKFARHSNITNTMIYNHTIDMLANECSDTIASNII